MYEIIVIAVESIMTLVLIGLILFAIRLKASYSFGSLALLILILSMMASMFNAMTYLIMAPSGFLTTIVAVNLAMLVMTLVIVILLILASREDRPKQGYSVAFWLAFLFVWNEASMGTFLYALISGSRMSVLGFFEISTYGINSYLFIAPMIAEMLFFLFLERPGTTYLLLTLSVLVMSVFNPLLIGEKWFILYGIVLTAVAMLVFMVLIVVLVSRKSGRLPYRETKVLEFFLLIYVLMSATLLIGAVGYPTETYAWFWYAITSLLVMGGYFLLYLSPLKMTEVAAPAEGNRNIVVPVVGAIFVSSVFAFLAIGVYASLVTF